MGLLDVFFEVTDEKGVKKDKSVPSIPSLKINTATFNPTSNSPQGDLSKFEAHFDELFDKANFPGPDYFEFIKMVQAMGPSIADNIKFPAIFSGLKVQGVTKDKLIQTAKQYIEVIDNDQKQFSTTIDTKINGDIKKKKDDLVNMQANIKQKEDLISQMQKEIIQENAALVNLATEISNDEKRFSDKSSAYKISCDNRKASIASDIEKINQYL